MGEREGGRRERGERERDRVREGGREVSEVEKAGSVRDAHNVGWSNSGTAPGRRWGGDGCPEVVSFAPATQHNTKATLNMHTHPISHVQLSTSGRALARL